MTLNVPEAPGTTSEIPEELFRHAKRPEWGLGVLVKDEEDRRTYRFQDGTLRKINEGYYALMRPVDELKDFDVVYSSLVAAVEEDAGAPMTGVSLPDAVCTFEEQVALFEELYPDGFAGAKWIEDHRGRPGTTPLKRHREPAVTAAREVLDGDRCRSLVENGGHATLVSSIADLLASTDLVPLAHVKVLRGMDEEEHRRYAEAVTGLRGQQDGFGMYFRGYLRTLQRILGKRPSWQVATALPALAEPQQHVCVRGSAFARQAASVSPGPVYTRRARLGAYNNYRRLAGSVRERLQEAGHEPRDFLDVHDFIWTTLRNSALEHLGATR